jgi:hypothetical protein
MSLDQWTAVDRYITDLLVPHIPELDGVLETSQTVGSTGYDGFLIALVTD